MNERSFDYLWTIWQERLTALSGKELQFKRRLGLPGDFIAVAVIVLSIRASSGIHSFIGSIGATNGVKGRGFSQVSSRVVVQ